MSHRPTQTKKLRRLRKALRQTPPAHIDLRQWLRLRGYADTNAGADRLILARKVKSESHTLGIINLPVRKPDGKIEDMDFVQSWVPATLRNTLRVAS